ncbi:MAG TPA: Fe-S cluster assembly protein SufD [Longimicrobiaceae bacterium]|nr:Fe-S cluster assembly protein SufD [Longimicrobiaceae bacterium]
MADTTVAGEGVGVFTRDQVQILSARKGEPEWLQEARLAAYDAFAEAPMPTTRVEEWRYTDIGSVLKLEPLGFAEEARPVDTAEGLPAGLRAVLAEAGSASARLAQTDASVTLRELPEELRARGVVFTSLEAAVREHPERVRRYLGTAVTPQAGKFAALSTAFWTGGLFLYVPRDVRVEVPFRSYRWVSEGGCSVFPRTLVVAEPGAEVALVDELASPDLGRQTLAVPAAEIFAEEGARVTYVALQRWGAGVVHLGTDRVVAGRDARVTALYMALGGDLARSDVQCRLAKPGSHVDLLGLYITDGAQHVDHETLQDHASPHASSNLLFKGALRDRSRSVFRGLIRVHPGAQRTDAYQTNRNLILSSEARADSLPNLEIQADDVRCSHAATVGQLDEEEIFYLLSRGIPKAEAVRLVVFGFFGEVLEQLPLPGVREELMRAVERKLARAREA